VARLLIVQDSAGRVVVPTGRRTDGLGDEQGDFSGTVILRRRTGDKTRFLALVHGSTVDRHSEGYGRLLMTRRGTDRDVPGRAGRLPVPGRSSAKRVVIYGVINRPPIASADRSANRGRWFWLFGAVNRQRVHGSFVWV